MTSSLHLSCRKITCSTLCRSLPDARVLLFGSQARGEAGKDSDYDLLIISDRVAALKGKMDYESKINKALVWSLDKPFDVLVKSRSEEHTSELQSRFDLICRLL